MNIRDELIVEYELTWGSKIWKYKSGVFILFYILFLHLKSMWCNVCMYECEDY